MKYYQVLWKRPKQRTSQEKLKNLISASTEKNDLLAKVVKKMS